MAFLKSCSLGSSICVVTTFCMARNMFSIRPGCFFSHSRSISPTATRCRPSWLPQRLQGMMGKFCAFAQRSVSFSGT
ncbi:hypothetical protein D3C71_2115300 [compost metagenome]